MIAEDQLVVSIEEGRKLLGASSAKMSDTEVRGQICQIDALAQLVVDMWEVQESTHRA